MLHEAFDPMPAFRDPDGMVWVWDSESGSYTKKPDAGLEQDRGHSTGGDNDLFSTNQLEHSELEGVPELEGHMSRFITLEEARQIGREALEREAGKSEWAPKGHVKCPNCSEVTDDPACPACGKDLTPEWNQEQTVLPTPSEHSNASEFTSWPDRVPKRNREKTDDSYPSMTLSATGCPQCGAPMHKGSVGWQCSRCGLEVGRTSAYEMAQKLAKREVIAQDEWDDFFQNSGAKTEIGKWLIDKQGQLHFDHGVHSLHENIAARDGIQYPADVGALGSVYNDGSADTQRVFPGFRFDYDRAQQQVEQAFGPVALQAPISQGAQEQPVGFQPIEITGGQWVIAPVHANQPITGTAWVKERAQTTYNPNEILVAEHLQPEDFAIWQGGVKAIITATGGLTSHAAYLASTEGIPVIIGIGESYNKIQPGNYLKIDPATKVITVMPGADPSMSSDEKRQVSDAYVNYQMQHGGSLKPTFAHVDEELAWKEANGPSLDSCPECGDPMTDQSGESVCHSCGHKQPIINATSAVLAPLGEAAIGGLAEMGGGAAAAGGAEAGAGMAGGGGMGQIGGLMQKALNGGAFRAGENTIGGGGGGGNAGAPGGGEVVQDPSEMQGVVTHVIKSAGVLSILESILNVLKQTPEALTNPANPLSYVDDVAAGALGVGGHPSMNTQAKTASVWHFADTFGEEEVGRATKNRGENSDPDQQSSSGDDPKEFGDSPEQLKDVDGPGGSADNQGIDQQGDPQMQEKALKTLHLNLPLVIEFANSDEPGSENPIIAAIDQLLEEAFPGYKDGTDQEQAESEHPFDEKSDEAPSEDESGEKPDDGDSKDKPDAKAASVWHFAFGEEGYASDSRNPYGAESQSIQQGIEGDQQPYLSCPNCGHNATYADTQAVESQGGDWHRCPKCGEEMSDPMDERDYNNEDQAPGHYDLYGPDQPTWNDMFPHEGAVKEAWGEMAPAGAPGISTPVPGAAVPGAAPVCPICHQTHAPGTACPTAAPVTAPAATGAPVGPLAPNTVVTKWTVVSFGEVPRCPNCGGDLHNGMCIQCGETFPATQPDAQPAAAAPTNVAPITDGYGSNTGFNVRADVDPEFAFFTAADEPAVEHEVEHHYEGDNDSTGEDAPWLDEAGAPLQEGVDYEMKTGDHSIPDRITIESVLPEKIVYQIHSGDVTYRHEVSKEEIDTDGTTFSPVQSGDAQVDSADGFDDYEAPVRPGQDATPQVDDLSTPSTVVSSVEGLEEYTGSFHGDAPDSRSWLRDGGSSDVAVDPALMAKFAGKDFSAREQREFIDEGGEARNLDRLDLDGTHYVVNEIDSAFNW